VAEKGQKKMAVTSTKDTSARLKTTNAGKSGSENMPLATPKHATIPTQTLQEVAQSLVALEMDLAEMKAAGMRWHAFPYIPKGGKVGLVVTLYHPDYELGIEDLGENNLVALIEKVRASEVATRKTTHHITE
jgi:hypothetical protein